MRRLLTIVALYAFHIGFARPVLRWVAGVRYRRRNLIPEGPCVVVSNHNSHLDAALLMGLFPLRRLYRVHPVAAADYFGKTWYMRALAMMCMNALPIDRKPAKGSDPMARFAEELRQGRSLVLFPEGSRGKAGVITRFRPGVGRLSNQVPGLLIVPVFLAGPERIWPRGELVPVPQGIDVIVGRPRSYPADEEPRVIADAIRDEVLALAPPPPPLPGPRPEPPLRLAVCGIDGDSRRAVIRAIVEQLGAVGRTLGLVDPMLQGDEGGVREVTGPIARGPSRTGLDLLAWLFGVHRRFRDPRFADLVERAQINEALAFGRQERFVVTEGNAIVDLMARATTNMNVGDVPRSRMNTLLRYVANERTIPLGNWWRYLRRAPEIWLLNQLDLVNPPTPDLLVLLDSPVEQTMGRLRSRGRRLLAHENEVFLDRLQTRLAEAGHYLERRRGVRLLRFDTRESDASQIAREVAEACREPIPSTTDPHGLSLNSAPNES